MPNVNGQYEDIMKYSQALNKRQQTFARMQPKPTVHANIINQQPKPKQYSFGDLNKRRIGSLGVAK
mgnify:FL=1